MKKIKREIVNRILDSADIVEVVSDFVTLKKRGANYIGLCPFHSERTPSFSVSKSRGICKCFSCGKGGSPINFLMELEQMSYQEALRWLAKKYNIEIEEQEETEEEKQQSSIRESLYAVNSFGLNHFEKNLQKSEEGRIIGLSYFHERALTDETINKFHLGYALENSHSLYDDAIKNGFNEEFLIKSGLCSKSERGIYDRFRGRVIFPVHSISGKVVAFGGRTLKTDKSVAKYVNSPESEIYSKSRELYGLFQARRAIVKEDKCYLVEGYMDVLSMSQSGIENVVASSGTSLTTPQVNLIHRFSENVTVIYDADPAGIKASLRGVDMLLSDGMNVKVVLFPEGEDPDSFARTHSREELAEYLKNNETDFIKFKTSVLLTDSGNDPLKRSAAISDILKSIAVIPNAITRGIYIEETARTFEMDAKILSLEVSKRVAQNLEELSKKNKTVDSDYVSNSEDTKSPSINNETVNNQPEHKIQEIANKKNPLLKYEKAILRYLLRYGMIVISETFDENQDSFPVTVLDYIKYELQRDNVTFSDKNLSQLFNLVDEKAILWDTQKSLELKKEIDKKRVKLHAEGIERIRQNANSISEINEGEKNLIINIEDILQEYEKNVRKEYFEKYFLSYPDDIIRKIATDLVSEKHTLSKIHNKTGHQENEIDKLTELVPRAIFELKYAILALQIEEIKEALKSPKNTKSDTEKLLTDLIEKNRIKTEFARFLGDRIVTPPIK